MGCQSVLLTPSGKMMRRLLKDLDDGSLVNRQGGQMQDVAAIRVHEECSLP